MGGNASLLVQCGVAEVSVLGTDRLKIPMNAKTQSASARRQ